ncbi:MAG TPA: DUF2271 domain-containing protein [Spirochaetia bacterium]
MKTRITLFPVLFSVLIAFTPVTAGAQTGDAARGLTLHLTPGPGYESYTSFLLVFRIPLYPQIACWLETTEGAYLRTLYVTQKGATRKFYSAPAGGRPEALPVWYHRQSDGGSAVDAVSGASSPGKSEIRLHADGALRPGRYVLYMEVNRSYDYNETFTREIAGVNGQPSLVFRAILDVTDGASTASFAPVGTGSVDGSDGAIRDGLEGITSALTIIEGATVDYAP